MSRIAELQEAFEAKQAFVREGLEKGIRIEGGNVEVKSADAAAIRQAVEEGNEIKALMEAELFGIDTDFVKSLGAPAGVSSAVASAAFAAGAGYNEAKSLGELFTGSDEFKHMLRQGRATMDSPFTLEQKDITSLSTYGQKDVFTGSAPAQTTRGFGRTQFDPMVPRAQRQTRVRDLFNVALTNANLIDYFRVTGFLENGGAGNAGPVRERAAADGTSAPTGTATDTFGLKPKSTLKFESAQAPVRTIAHWEAAHRNVLADEPQLQSTINNELLYGLALEEDDQILNGDGTGENLLGILNTPGVQTYTQAVGDQKSDALRRATTLSVIANYPATGYVLHPLDWEDIELQKAQGDGQYMLVTNIQIGAAARVWRQPVVETPAMTEGTFLTGAFGLGAQLYDRQVANIRIAEQHADFFVRNAIAILAEERLALAVKRPESFVVGTFAA